MTLMAQRTLEVPGHAIKLCVHRRAAFEQVSLRWRLSHGTRAHLSWAEVAERISDYPRALMLWYQQANLLSQQLNVKEREARAALRKAREDLAGLDGELGQLI
ncbi:MAG: hypothetical protein C0460_14320 [Methylibium sp.]|jgi:hypothetical protein|nr:hypothetical protein [Methylibium sp.]